MKIRKPSINYNNYSLLFIQKYKTMKKKLASFINYLNVLRRFYKHNFILKFPLKKNKHRKHFNKL